MRVAFQGETGAFSEEAVTAYFGTVSGIPLSTFEAVFGAVVNGTVDRAVVPIENSLHGSVHSNYDLLDEYRVRIVGEITLRIRHNLLVLPGVRPNAIRRVSSHPQALGQCRRYLREMLPGADIVPAYDTAGAAKMLADSQDRETAVIASGRAAAEYGLETIATSIESNHQNYTRFIALADAEQAAGAEPPETIPCKTAIVYSMKDNVPGALFKSLAVFALRDIDLFKIESRPLVGSPGQYLFYLDMAGRVSDPAVDRALGHLGELTASLKVLGSFGIGRVVE